MVQYPRYSQGLVVEVEANGNAGGGENPSQIEGEDANDFHKFLIHRREGHVRDIGELRGQKVGTVDSMGSRIR